MKFTVERDALREALSVVAGRAAKGSTIPILSHVLIECQSQNILLTGHDMDTCSQASAPSDVTMPGAIALPADRLQRLVSGLPDGSQMSFDIAARSATIRCAHSTYQFGTLPADDFPPALEIENAISITLSGKQVVRLFKAPAPCISVSRDRIYLQGIYLHVRDNKLTAVASDGHTLFRAAVDVAPPAFEGVIVPDKSCDEIARLAGDCDQVTLEVSERIVAIEAGSRRFATKLIDATFPGYDPIVNAVGGPFMTVASKDFDGAMARLLSALDEKAKSRAVRIEWDDDASTFRATLSSMAHSGEENIEIDCPGREAGYFGANLDYLRRIVGCLGGRNTRFITGERGSPIRMENPDDPDVVGVVMPLNV